MINKKGSLGQVWIETVLYTLIGLALMGVVLAFVTPKLNAEKDKIAVDQTIRSLNDFDDRINIILQAPGNVREIDISMQKGIFTVNSTVDSVSFYFGDLTQPYSEPGVPITIGRITALSQKNAKSSSVLLTLAYADNLTFNQQDIDKVFTASSIPYKFSVSNLGVIDANSGKNVISITELGN